MRLFLIVCACLLLPSIASAQHPCDVATPTTVTVNSNGTHYVAFCARPGDFVEAFTVYLNGVASDLRPLEQAGAPNAAGLALYTGPRELQFPVGNYEIRLTVWNVEYTGGPTQESELSAPLLLSAVAGNPRPMTPVIKGVHR